MKHPSQTTILLPLIAAAICFGAPSAHAESKTATVSPGKTEVVKFDGDPSGIYQLNIEATSGHTINDSDFTAEFKSSTLWQRNSKTSYNITYTTNPKPPGVSVEGDFERSGGDGGEGYSPNFFLVNVPNVDCEPEERELIVRHRAAQGGSFYDVKFEPNTGGTKSLWLASMRIYAYWENKEYGCNFVVGVCQNARFNASIKYSDNSSIGVSTSAYLLDGNYPDHANGSSGVQSGGTHAGKQYKWMYDHPSVTIKTSAELEYVSEVHYTLEAENFFMLIPEQGPPVSKMNVTWSSSGTATLVDDELQLSSHSSSPSVSQVTNIGAESERPPVSQGENANVYLNKRWKQLSGGPNSRAAQFLSNYNNH